MGGDQERMMRLSPLRGLLFSAAAIIGLGQAAHVRPYSGIAPPPLDMEFELRCYSMVTTIDPPGDRDSNSECTRVCHLPADSEMEAMNRTLEKCSVERADYYPTEGWITDPCYAGYVHGYIGDTWDVADSAGYGMWAGRLHLCQAMCQFNKDCVQFLYRPLEEAPNGIFNCFLKNQEQVDRAWNGSATWNNAFCPPDITAKCQAGQLECLGENTCIYCSERWISGPKWCTRDEADPWRPLPAHGQFACDYTDRSNYTTTPTPPLSTSSDSTEEVSSEISESTSEQESDSTEQSSDSTEQGSDQSNKFVKFFFNLFKH